MSETNKKLFLVKWSQGYYSREFMQPQESGGDVLVWAVDEEEAKEIVTGEYEKQDTRSIVYHPVSVNVCPILGESE